MSLRHHLSSQSPSASSVPEEEGRQTGQPGYPFGINLAGMPLTAAGPCQNPCC